MQNSEAIAFPLSRFISNNQYRHSSRSYYRDLGPRFWVLFPEPWLYIRSGIPTLRHVRSAVASSASAGGTGNSEQPRKPWLALSVYR